jgi:hypothetical protein
MQVMEEAKVFDSAFSTERDMMCSPVAIVNYDVWVFDHGSDFRVVAIEGAEFFK